jgi:hypothetical protein
VLNAVETRRAGIASGVNNAAARTGSLLAVAALPALVGLSGEQYRSAHAVDHAFRAAVAGCAGLLAAAALLSWTAIPRRLPERSEPAPEVDGAGTGSRPA